MAKAPAYQMYAADFAMATMGWPSDPLAAHIRLMNSQWINDGLPNDIQELAGIAGLSLLKFRKAWERLESRYPVCADGRRRNPRLESERQKQQEYRDKQANAAAMRWHKPAISPKVSQSDALQSSSSSSSSTTSSNQKQKQEPTARATRLPELFQVTPEHRYFALENDLPSPDDHIAEFRDYWLGKAGANAKKLDWDATFRNWLRKAKEFKGRAHGERKAQISQDQQRRDFEQLMAESLNGESDSEATVQKQHLLPDSGAKARGSGGLVEIGKSAGAGKVY